MSGYYKDEHKYDDIINMPNHRSKERPAMSLHDRAAQFAPFAALTGHNEAIAETARVTDEWMVLDDTAIEAINHKLCEISQNLQERRNVSVTYFRPDAHKSGGAYLTDVGIIKKIDEHEKVVIMDNGMRIPMEYIVEICG